RGRSRLVLPLREETTMTVTTKLGPWLSVAVALVALAGCNWQLVKMPVLSSGTITWAGNRPQPRLEPLPGDMYEVTNPGYRGKLKVSRDEYLKLARDIPVEPQAVTQFYGSVTFYVLEVQGDMAQVEDMGQVTIDIRRLTVIGNNPRLVPGWLPV